MAAVTPQEQKHEPEGEEKPPKALPSPVSAKTTPSTPPPPSAAMRDPSPSRLSATPPVSLDSVRPSAVPRTVVYRSRGVSKWRFVRAYTTTFMVIGSYTWLSFRSRFTSTAMHAQALAKAHGVNAHRVYTTILELQGLFIKVGQLLSILANFLPQEFRKELEGLQDQVPPRPFSEIKPKIEEELGGSIGSLFADFKKTPIASASLGQVHEARLEDGRRVAVKVQHADIDEIVRLDLKTIRRIMTIVQWFVPVQGLDAYYHQIRELLSQELDFVQEADSIEKISANFENDARVRFPVPVRSHSTHRVLTTTYVEGAKIGDVSALDKMHIDKKDLANRLVRAYCQMIFVDGIYHADPHPGNLLVDEEGNLILLDFGAVAVLSQEMRSGIPEFLEGVIRRDTDRIIKALRKMGFISRTSDEATSEKIVEYFHRRFQEEVKLESFNLKDIKIDPQKGLENLLDLRKMDVGIKELSHVFHVPKDWVLLERTILLVYGCCTLLDPELNPMGIIQPYLQEFVLGSRDWQQVAMETIRDMALGAVTLPEDLRKYLTRATRGEMEVRVRGLTDGARTVYSIGRQLIYTAVGIAAGFVALSMHQHGENSGAHYFAFASGFCFFLLCVSSLLSRPSGK